MKLIEDNEMMNIPWSKRFHVENDEVVIGVHKNSKNRKYSITGYYKDTLEFIPLKEYYDPKKVNQYVNKFGINFTNLPN